MSFNIKHIIEKKFREGRSSDELFDSFQQALKHKLKDVELYKILLANVALNPDEVKMFTEKLCREFEDFKYDIYMWSAGILESTLSIDNLEAAYGYYKKASELDLTNHLPFISMIKMYNIDLDLPPKDILIETMRKAIKEVKKKSLLSKEIAMFFGNLGDEIMMRKYMTLAAKFHREENG